MLTLLASTILSGATPEMNRSEQINKFCATVVGIPYASDNFSDEEWTRFVYCRETLK